MGVMMGWKLGIIESVIVTVIIGLAVDYIVHLANSYMEAPAKTRFERTQHALTEMGISVLSASITTVGRRCFSRAPWLCFLSSLAFFWRSPSFTLRSLGSFCCRSSSFMWAQRASKGCCTCGRAFWG